VRNWGVFWIIVVGGCLVAGCSPAAPVDDGPEFDEPSPTATYTLPSQAPEPTTFPAGFPKVVRVASLPDRLRARYQDRGATEAVQVAPGVWTPVQESATLTIAGVLDGDCASVKAFEQQYRGGRTHPGFCW
jgi:hypothetical protein